MPPLLFQLKEVYKLSLFNVNQTVASKARNTSTVPIKDKQFLTQELAVTNLGAAQNGNISVAHSATFEQREMARDAKLCVTGQSDGKLIISADGEMPDIDIPVVITLLG